MVPKTMLDISQGFTFRRQDLNWNNFRTTEQWLVTNGWTDNRIRAYISVEQQNTELCSQSLKLYKSIFSSVLRKNRFFYTEL